MKPGVRAIYREQSLDRSRAQNKEEPGLVQRQLWQQVKRRGIPNFFGGISHPNPSSPCAIRFLLAPSPAGIIQQDGGSVTSRSL
jgi:hypothetical protein